MKKLIVLLLALAVVGAVSAQVTTNVSLSGSVYLYNKQGATEAAKVAPNGTGYDVLTLSAVGKDKNFGATVKDNNLISTAALNVDLWNVWYKVGTVKATLGNLNGGSYVQYFNNAWLQNMYPTDNMAGVGLLAETTLSGVNLGVFLPLGTAGTDIVTYAKKSVIGLSYAIPKQANLCGQVNLDLVTNATVANVGFDFTGVAGLDVYGWAEYAQATSAVAGGIGAQYKAATWRVGAEFEGNANFSVWDVIANARYYVNPTLFVQVRPEYRSNGRMRVRGYVNYAFGNGFAAEGMVGYDQPTSGYVGLVDYVRLTYSVAF